MTTSKKNADEILKDFAGWDMSELREYLTTIFTSFVSTDEWKSFSKEWKDNFMFNHRLLHRLMEEVDAWDKGRFSDKL